MFLRLNKKLILLLVILLIVLAIFYLERQRIAPEIKTSQQDVELKDGKFPKAPELVGISGYLNTEESLTIESLKGKVILIDFWTYTCINCIRTLPHLTSWDEKYRDKGLVIIGVHTPEFEFEKVTENVQMAMEKYNIKYPVVQDNDYATWSAFRNSYWPRKYLIDSEGFIRYDHIGEGAYKETEDKIQELLMEAGTKLEDMPQTHIQIDLSKLKQLARTPELYAGYNFALNRGQNVNPPGLQPGQIIDYTLPEKIAPNTIHLKGKWKSNPDNLEALEDAEILLDFTASEVNIVTGPLTQPQAIEVTIGQDTSTLEINSPQLYNLYKGKHTNSLLKIKVKQGFNFNAFTFG